MKLASFLIPTILLATIACLSGCSKSNSGSKPVISIKSINNTTVPEGGELDILLNFKVQANDLSGGYLVAYRTRLNQHPLQSTVTPSDTVSGVIPQFPDQTTGELEFTQGYNFLHESDSEPDTIIFSFAAIDRNGKSSDTITTPKIVILN